MKRALLALAMVLSAAHTVAAYTHVIYEQDGEYVALSWPTGSRFIQLSLHSQSGLSLPNVTPGSNVPAAIARALTVWPAVSGIDFELRSTSTASAGRDGTNLISFADTRANAMQLEMAGDPIALTQYFFVDDAIVEADILFNAQKQFTTTATTEDDLDAQDAADVEAVAVHELGHVIGLSHSGIESASMWAFSSLSQRHLDPDDIAGTRALYPTAEGAIVVPTDSPAPSGPHRGAGDVYRGHDGACPSDSDGCAPAQPGGTISGIVRVSGQPAFGAHVVAVHADGPVISTLTLPDGKYRLGAVPAGSYTLYVEPLDGPHGSVFIEGCVRFGNMGGAGIYDGAELTTEFPTTFYGDTSPVELTVDPDYIVLADFDLPAGTSAINPARIGAGTPEGTFTRLASFPFTLQAGATNWVAVAGAGLDRVDDRTIRVVGSGITVDTSDVRRPGVSCGGSQLPTLIFALDVPIDEVAGGRTLILASGDELAAFSGAVEVEARTTLPACVGDCDLSGDITVDELVRGVNITLDRTPLSVCQVFDRDGNEQVTIDELVAGVNGLLIGCE